MSVNKYVKLPINVNGDNGTSEGFIGGDKKALGICLGLLSPIIVTGKIVFQAAVRHSVTYANMLNMIYIPR